MPRDLTIQVLGGILATWLSPSVMLTAAIIAGLVLWSVIGSHSRRLAEGRTKMPMPQFLVLIGMGGVWLFATVGLAAAAWWMIYSPPPTTTITSATADDAGPLVWNKGLSMEGGQPLGLPNVFSVRFRGANTSQEEIKLISANMVSAINGTSMPIEINVPPEIVPLDQIDLVPPGAPIELIAKLGPPDPNAPGKILGISNDQFIATWRKFFVVIEDNKRKYRLSYNENDLAPFFPGLVGPHVSKKSGK